MPVIAVLAAYFAAPPVPAQSRGPATDDAVFDFGGAPDGGGRADDVLETGEAAFNGNPAASAFDWWPSNLVAAPIPGYSPQLGWQLTLVGGYFIDLDKASDETPQSVVGAVGMTSENDSRAGGFGGKFYLSGDRTRVAFGVASVDVNYRYYGSGDEGVAVDISQAMDMRYVSVLREVASDVYVGVGWLGNEVETGLRLGDALPPGLPDPSFRTDLSALELQVQYDTRDATLFPRSGWLANGSALLYRSGIGSDVSANVYRLEANQYRPMRSRDVLALRAYYRTVDDGDVPFFLLSSFGGKRDLRGFESGRYRDESMYAVQAEYRWRPKDRWVFTGFAGVGGVAAEFGDLFDDVLAAAGIGARYMVSRTHDFSVSVDFAVSDDDRQFYFGINEAF